jgi:hypothetical protein
MDDWKLNWEAYLKRKYPLDNIPKVIILDISEIDFYIPPLLGINTNSFKAIQKHNAKISIF